jgi:putative addiction module component (TIGR02574 family)
MTVKQIEAAAIKLPKRDRERIVNRLRETLRSKRDQQVLDAWVAEAERRDRELDEGKEVALPYEEVMAELRSSFRGR